jgi:glycosyltransferase involved in cell wall biosynthesis
METTLLGVLQSPSFCLHLAARDKATAVAGGDLYLAGALTRALRCLGHDASLRVEPDSAAAASFDVRLHMHGRRASPPTQGQISVLWLVSHPAAISEPDFEVYDLVLCGSPSMSRRLRSSLGTPVEEFLQFTDAERFRPSWDESVASDVLFVGNWRGVLRQAVWDAVQLGRSVTVYGQGWAELVPELDPRGPVPNTELPKLYSSCRVLLTDHWDDMRANGFIANRVFDALACGAVVISDHMPELEEVLPNGVLTYRGPADLDEKLDRYLSDDEARERVASAGQTEVLSRHTAEARAATLVRLAAALCGTPTEEPLIPPASRTR